MSAAILSGRDGFSDIWLLVLQASGPVGRYPVEISQDALPAETELAVIDASDLALAPLDRVVALHKALPGAKLIVAGRRFAVDEEIAYLGAGCVACCSDRQQVQALARIVDIVRNGGIWLSRDAVPLVLERMQRLSERPAAPTRSETAVPAESAAASLSVLTERELQVAKEVGRGASNKQIARNLDITDRTVKAHLSAIFSKLGFSDRVQLALYMNRQHAPLHRQST